jgi:hypothetical protein
MVWQPLGWSARTSTARSDITRSFAASFANEFANGAGRSSTDRQLSTRKWKDCGLTKGLRFSAAPVTCGHTGGARGMLRPAKRRGAGLCPLEAPTAAVRLGDAQAGNCSAGEARRRAVSSRNGRSSKARRCPSAASSGLAAHRSAPAVAFRKVAETATSLTGTIFVSVSLCRLTDQGTRPACPAYRGSDRT